MCHTDIIVTTLLKIDFIKKSQSDLFDLLNKIFDNSSQIDCAGATLRFAC